MPEVEPELLDDSLKCLVLLCLISFIRLTLLNIVIAMA